MLVHRLIAALKTEHGLHEARSMAYLVVRYVTGLSQAVLLRDAREPFPKELLPKVNNILRQLKKRMPIQYLMGETKFYGCRIVVNPAVLIPRPETEELVYGLLQKAKKDNYPGKILDIGTGSGCIAIAFAREVPEAEMYASDVTEEILSLAQKNARENGVDVHFFRQDILKPENEPKETYRFIVSNPPYIPESEKITIQPEVLLHEPARALFVPDKDPLLYYRAILEYSAGHLEEEGWLMVETHERFAGKVKDLFENYRMNEVEVKTDINGKERFVAGRR